MSSSEIVLGGEQGTRPETFERSSESGRRDHRHHHHHHLLLLLRQDEVVESVVVVAHNDADDDLSLQQQQLTRRPSILSSTSSISSARSGGGGGGAAQVLVHHGGGGQYAWSGLTRRSIHDICNYNVAFSHEINEEERGIEHQLELEWAAIERLPTFRRIRSYLSETTTTTTAAVDKGTFSCRRGNNNANKIAVIDVPKLGSAQSRVFIDKLLKKIDDDNRHLLLRVQNRLHRVGLKLPTIEVRYKNLSIEAEWQVVHGKPLPTWWKSLKGFFPDIRHLTGGRTPSAKVKILENVSGIIKPSRMTLLLGPPGCGKTTLLLALAGKLDQNLEVTGEISYNGYKINEFLPQKTSAYISQYDLHISEMTVRETIDFSARCQGTGSRAEIITELSRREKEAGLSQNLILTPI